MSRGLPARAGRAPKLGPLLALAATAALLHTPASSGSAIPAPDHNVLDTADCYSEACNRTSAALARFVNASADPCDDFFEFACGGYIASTQLPPRHQMVTVFSQMDEQLREQVSDLLAEPIADADPAFFKKAKRLYRGCVRTGRLNDLGLEPATKILTGLGGWPLAEEDRWDESKFDWKELSYKMMDMGMYSLGLFTVIVGVDISNTTRHTLALSPPHFNLALKSIGEMAGVPRLAQYRSVIQGAAELLRPGDRLNGTRLATQASQTALFELELESSTQSLEDQQNLTLAKHMSVGELQARYPYVPWLEYFRRLLPESVGITAGETVLVADHRYFESLGPLLQSTPKRTLANYMVWRGLEDLVFPHLDDDFRDLMIGADLERASLKGRWEHCVKLVQRTMRSATSAMYARRHSSEEARRTARAMVQDIRKELHQVLEAATWMDPDTKRAAMLKAESMRYNVAFPDELLNDTALDELFSGVEVDEHRLVESLLSLEKHAFRQECDKLRVPVKKQDWTYVSGYTDFINAFYNRADNSMSIPAGILQSHFFQKDRPQYMNYGAIGFVIGHEASHGFDQMGSLFNEDGLMANWWDAQTRDLFHEKVGCIVDQYSSIADEETNVTVNGVLTQSENIADNAGLKLAYRAYRRYTARRGEEPRVVLHVPSRPGVPAAPGPVQELGAVKRLALSPRQMFWLSFASVWCSKETVMMRDRTLRTSTHLPGTYRVNGALRNQEAFAQDFNCPAGAPMNPSSRCHIW